VIVSNRERIDGIARFSGAEVAVGLTIQKLIDEVVHGRLFVLDTRLR
jgi:hypothetical protein